MSSSMTRKSPQRPWRLPKLPSLLINNFQEAFNKEKSIADKKEEIAKTASELESAQSELQGLGIFKISRKKELKDLIATLELTLSKLNEDLTKIEEKFKGDIRAITSEATAQKNAYTKELDKKYILPLSPAEKNKANKK